MYDIGIISGIGFGMIITLLVISIYYNTIIAWTLYYMANSVQGIEYFVFVHYVQLHVYKDMFRTLSDLR